MLPPPAGDGCLGSEGGTATYEGRWSDDERHGHGKQVSSNGDVYSGQWHADRRSGRGQLLSVDGSSYEGMWDEGMRNGTGTLKMTDGDEYDGDWVDDVRSGVGRHINKDGEEYKGQWADGERCGRGRCLYARQPDFKPPPPGFTSVAVSTPPPTLSPPPRPKMLGATSGGAGPGPPGRGLGRATPPNRHMSGNLSGAIGGTLNDVYEGQWSGGVRCGEGRFAGAKPPFGSGDVYTGQWVDDERHGHGRCAHDRRRRVSALIGFPGPREREDGGGAAWRVVASLALALAFVRSPLHSPPPPPLPSPLRTPPPSPSPGVSTATARCTRAAGSRESRTARARSHSCRRRPNRQCNWGVCWGGDACGLGGGGRAGRLPSRKGGVPGICQHGNDRCGCTTYFGAVDRKVLHIYSRACETRGW